MKVPQIDYVVRVVCLYSLIRTENFGCIRKFRANVLVHFHFPIQPRILLPPSQLRRETETGHCGKTSRTHNFSQSSTCPLLRCCCVRRPAHFPPHSDTGGTVSVSGQWQYEQRHDGAYCRTDIICCLLFFRTRSRVGFSMHGRTCAPAEI